MQHLDQVGQPVAVLSFPGGPQPAYHPQRGALGPRQPGQPGPVRGPQQLGLGHRTGRRHAGREQPRRRPATAHRAAARCALRRCRAPAGATGGRSLLGSPGPAGVSAPSACRGADDDDPRRTPSAGWVTGSGSATGQATSTAARCRQRGASRQLHRAWCVVGDRAGRPGREGDQRPRRRSRSGYAAVARPTGTAAYRSIAASSLLRSRDVRAALDRGGEPAAPPAEQRRWVCGPSTLSSAEAVAHPAGEFERAEGGDRHAGRDELLRRPAPNSGARPCRPGRAAQQVAHRTSASARTSPSSPPSG